MRGDVGAPSWGICLGIRARLDTRAPRHVKVRVYYVITVVPPGRKQIFSHVHSDTILMCWEFLEKRSFWSILKRVAEGFTCRIVCCGPR